MVNGKINKNIAHNIPAPLGKEVVITYVDANLFFNHLLVFYT